MMEQENQYRLPPGMEPKRYDLTLTPNPAIFSHTGDEKPPEAICTLGGTVDIFIDMPEGQSRITFHVRDIELLSGRYTDSLTRKEYPVLGFEYRKEIDMADAVFGEEIPAGPGTFSLEFRAKVNDNLESCYLLKYTVDGKTVYGIATQFEPTEARGAFPCFDEPEKKAIFGVKIILPDGVNAQSNGSRSEVRIKGDKGELREHIFRDTPKMSTYLVAWTAKQDEAIEKEATFVLKKDGREDAHTVRLAVVTDPGESYMGAFALEEHETALAFYTEFTGIHYPYDKCYLIALSDFAAGAMENLGAITFRKQAILADPAHASIPVYKRIALVVKHENAHMWFGDLVTMRWWNSIWLNEAFATFMEYLCLDHDHPEWQVMMDFFVQDGLAALDDGARRNARSIENEVRTPAQIGQAFDGFAYAMGGRGLNQLFDHIGRKAFQDGLHNYLTKHVYGNTDPSDLWDAFKEASGKPVREMMDKFVLQKGYPLLTVERTGVDMLLIRQRRFFSDGSKDEAGTLWHVPLTIQTKSSVKVTAFIDAELQYVPVPNTSANEWIKLNAGQTAFCRVAYSKEMMSAFIPAVKKKQLDPIDRLGLLSDTFASARAGAIKTSEALELLTAYAQDDDFFVWQTVARCLGEIDTLIYEEWFHDQFDAFARDMYLPHAKRLGWKKSDGEDPITTQFRSLALHGAGRHGNEEILSRAQAEFGAHLEHKSLEPDLRALVYALVSQSGSEEQHRALHKLHDEANTDQEKAWLRTALSRTKDEKLFREYLEFLLSSRVRKQDAPIGLQVVVGRGKHGEILWDFVESHWDYFAKEFASHNMLKRTFYGAREFHTPAMLHRVRTFFETHTHPTIDRAIAETLEDIETNVVWLERDREDIAEWLEAHVSNAN